jgi:putative transposase
VRRRGRKPHALARVPLVATSKINQRWSMDFMRDTLADGRKFRILNIVDDFSRENPAIEFDTPRCPAIAWCECRAGCAQCAVYPRRSSPTMAPNLLAGYLMNGLIVTASSCTSLSPANRPSTLISRASTASFRHECLNANYFLSLADARATIGLAHRLQGRAAALESRLSHS